MASASIHPEPKPGSSFDPTELASQETRVRSEPNSPRRADCEALVRAHYARVYNFLLWLCGNAQDAEDLCQETFIKVWKNLHRFRGKSSALTWILRIARNTYLDGARRNQRDCLAQSHDDKTECLPDPGASPSEKLAEKERAEKLVDALARLPEPIRSAVVLHYREELSYRQLALAMEIPVGTAKYHVSEGLRQLRELLGTDGERP